jgi:transmembrane sensor
MTPRDVTPQGLTTLLVRYLDGEATADDVRLLQAEVGRVQLLEEALDGSVVDADVAKAWEGVHARVENRTSRAKVASWTKWDAGRSGWGLQTLWKGTSSGRRTLRGVLAPSIGVGALLLAGFWVIHSKTSVPHIASPRIYTTAVRQRATVTLVDGSRITLAPQSRLEVSSAFGTTTRLVTLRGDALFDVSATGGVPFTVRTGAVTTRVLGTKFVVQHYGIRDTVQVVVLSGKVSTGGQRTSVTLSAGMMARVVDSTAVVSRVSDLNAAVSWTQGQLVFVHTPVPTVLTTLSRWYGYRFIIGDSAIAKRRVTAAFKASAAQETLEDLKDLLDVTVSFQDSTVTLRSRRGTGKQQAPGPRREYDVFHPHTEVGR